MKLKFPLHIHISTLFLVLILIVGGVVAGVGFKLSRDTLQLSAQDLVARIGVETGNEIEAVVAPVELAVSLLSQSSLIEGGQLSERIGRAAMLRTALLRSPSLSSIYIGYANGDFFYMRRLRDDAERKDFNSPEQGAFLVQSIERTGDARGRYIYLDAELNVLREDERPDFATSYDPRTRPWFNDAMAAGKAIKTAPYLFFSNIATRRKVGLTVASPNAAGDSVVGADILLETLADSLKQRKPTPGTEIALVNQEGLVLAHEDLTRLVTMPATPEAKPQLTALPAYERPALTAAAGLLAQFDGSAPLSSPVQAGGEDWQVSINAVPLEGMKALRLVIATPDRELLAAAFKLRSTSLLVTLAIILIAVPITWLLAQRIARPLRTLHAEAERIRRFDFSGEQRVRSLIKEVEELSETMDSMKRAIRRFIDISRAVGGESNIDRLMPMLLRETVAAAEVDLGILYLADNEALEPMAVVGKDGAELSLALRSLPPGEAGALVTEGLTRLAYAGPLSTEDKMALGLDADDAPRGLTHGVTLALRNRQHNLVGAMVLLRHSPVDDAQLSFISNLAVSSASSLETRELIKAQKELFEAFIKLIAGAIDAKSPYTGGHCARVPELTKMLARAACAQTEGPYKDFTLADDQWEAVHVGAWLHDCGKVTTPEYVVDKATKLETLYDRIHEVRMRFEVLKRDARIAYFESRQVGAGETAIVDCPVEKAAKARLDAELAQLDDDYRFIATCNEGGEFMAKEKLERLQAIAARTWLRTLDDRIGISHEEKQRKERAPAPTLPVMEPLLADKVEHLFERGEKDRMPEDNPWGFRMAVPELLYNKGELYNLSVARGTLSEEERFKINEHITQTVIMLTQLPFPKHLRDVPEIAGGHHEKMDGTGYPKRLTKDEMSPVARMMSIADVFEALTAVDRPYKKGKTLSEAIKIMSFMKKDQHIDADLFALFLRSGIYLDYAKKYMKPEQIDAVDVAAYLG